jgi:hypothetical protein
MSVATFVTRSLAPAGRASSAGEAEEANPRLEEEEENTAAGQRPLPLHAEAGAVQAAAADRQLGPADGNRLSREATARAVARGAADIFFGRGSNRTEASSVRRKKGCSGGGQKGAPIHRRRQLEGWTGQKTYVCVRVCVEWCALCPGPKKQQEE